MGRFCTFPKDIHAPSIWFVGVDVTKFNAGIWLGLRIVNGAKVGVSGELVFAEGRHGYVVRAWSCSSVSLVV